jgi:hypothetical protein
MFTLGGWALGRDSLPEWRFSDASTRAMQKPPM